MNNYVVTKRNLSSFQIIIIGFLIVILTGSFLLMLPVSTRSGKMTPFSDALFTATSATCVTGLVVKDTATYWSEFGQAVILLLIQIGGMGVVTVAVSFFIISGRKIGLIQRSIMTEAIAAPSIGGIVKLTGFILRATFFVELSGALLMMPVFMKDFGVIKGIWYSIFHSVSAFCNAGFDLMGSREEFSSLTAYGGNPIINIAVMSLIVIGGIGFLTWEDILNKGIHIRKYRMQSKVILFTTGILIILPFIFFFFGEFGNDVWGDMSLGKKFMAALFQTITPRTAGFNTIDISLFSESGQTVMIILMIIGGSPGSTAGGIKTTTVAVLFITLFAVFHRKEDSECFGRRISEDVIRNAVAIFVMYMLLFVSGAIAISCLEELPILTCMFETASAIGTVGLTLGITKGLGIISRIILIVLMFLGRVGGLTLVFAAFSEKERHLSRLPKERITVG